MRDTVINLVAKPEDGEIDKLLKSIISKLEEKKVSYEALAAKSDNDIRPEMIITNTVALSRAVAVKECIDIIERSKND